MKKIYILLLISFSALSFGQTIYSENMGTPTGNTTVANYITGTSPATFQNASPIIYTGTTSATSMRVTLPSSSTYLGNSGGGNVFLSATTSVGHFFQIDGINTSAYSSANLQMTFGLNTSSVSILPILEYSTNASTWTPITFVPTGTGWTLVTIAGGILPASSTLSLRFTQPSTTAVPNTAQFRLDDIKVFNFNSSCTLVLGTPTTVCDAVTSGIDTYTATIPYTGGGSGTNVITASSGTVNGDNPNTVATGNITVTGVNEGTALTVDIVNGSCSYSSTITTIPECKVVNALPFYDGFAYTAGVALGSSQLWTGVNTGDDVVAQTGSLVYSGSPSITTAGNSETFGGVGKEAFTPFTTTNSGILYTQFLMSVTDLTAVTDLTGTAYFAGVTDGTSGGYKAKVFTKRNGTQYLLGLTANSETVIYDTTLRNIGDVLRIVVAYDFAGNTLSMWVNPAASGSAPILGLTPAAAITGMGGFILRQDAANTTPIISFDELTITTNISDLGLTSLSTNQFNEIAGLKMYPNPVNNGKLYLSSDSIAEKTVAIYDIVGKQIINEVVNEFVNVSSLNAGVYVVKITEEGKTATRKLVVR